MTAPIFHSAKRGDENRVKSDPLVRAFLAAVAIAFVVGVALGVRVLMTQRGVEPVPQSSTASASRFLDSVKRQARAGMDQLGKLLKDSPPSPAPPRQKPVNPQAAGDANTPVIPIVMNTGDPKRVYAAAPPPDGAQVIKVPAAGNWTYDVFFGPGWQKTGQLRYTTQRQADQAVGANMSWIPNAGQASTWFLGVMEADHPSHANTRFPGFFMHPVYLPPSPQPGSLVVWEFPWQGGGKAQMRRFDMRVAGWETVTVPAGVFTAVRIEGKLRYVDNESVKAEVRYELWYSPRARQVVRLLWLGQSPDESNAEMIAELAGFTAP